MKDYPAITPETAAAIAAELTRQTSNHWEAEPHPYREDAFIFSEMNRTTRAPICALSFSRWSSWNEKASISTHYPPSVEKARYTMGFNAPSESIKLNPDRPADRIAADIIRRLLPAARTHWETMRQGYHTAAQRQEAINQTAEAIRAMGEVKEQTRTPYSIKLYAYWAKGYFSADVQEDKIAIERMELSPAHGIAVLKYAAELMAAPQNWSQLQESINQ